MTETPAADLKQGLSEGLLIAALTGVSYWIAFSYEQAYLSAFGFPLHLAKISVESVLIVFLLLSTGLWLLLPVANLIGLIWPTHPVLQVKAARAVLVFGMVGWQLFHYGFRTIDIPFYLIVIGIWFVFEVLWPLVVFWRKKGIKQRLIADEEAEASPLGRTVLGRLYKSVGPSGYSFIVIAILGTWFASSAGDAKARTQTSYLVFSSNPAISVVRLYPEQALCVRLAPKSRKIMGLLVVPTGNGEIEFRKKEIGPIILQRAAHPS